MKDCLAEYDFKIFNLTRNENLATNVLLRYPVNESERAVEDELEWVCTVTELENDIQGLNPLLTANIHYQLSRSTNNLNSVSRAKL